MSLPAWLQRHLETIGAANPDGVSRAARATTCRGCRRPVIVGLDADTAAISATCDDQEIDEIGECLALIQGRSTYTLTQRGTPSDRCAWNLDHRNQFHIAGNRKYEIVPAHQCGQRLPPAKQPRISATPHLPPDDQDPPF